MLFPYASFAVTVMLKGEPVAWGLLIVLKSKLYRAPGLTVKVPLVPVMPEPDVKMVTPEPAPVTVTEPVQIPLLKTPVLTGLIEPLETLKVLVPT
jgi:hypothetical protein